MKSIPTSTNRRRSHCLHGYDYSLPGAYFVTLICWQRQPLFGEIKSGRMLLNDIGNIIRFEWLKLANQCRFMKTDVFVIMPNHLHGIILIDRGTDVGATRPLASENMFCQDDGLPICIGDCDGSPLPITAHLNRPVPGSLGAIIGQCKSRATKRIWRLPGLARRPIWQRNYYDHIVRNAKSLENIYRYIIANPASWAEDEYYLG
jgi:putative transposase